MKSEGVKSEVPSEIRGSEIRGSEIRISSNHRELHGAIFFRIMNVSWTHISSSYAHIAFSSTTSFVKRELDKS